MYRGQFAASQGMDENELLALEKYAEKLKEAHQTRMSLDDEKKINEMWTKQNEEWKATWKGVLERLGTVWSFFQTEIEPWMKWFIILFDKMVQGMTWASRVIPGFSTEVGIILKISEAALLIGSTVGVLKMIGGMFTKIPVIGTMLEASAARIGATLAPYLGMMSILRGAGLIGAAITGASIGHKLKVYGAQYDEYQEHIKGKSGKEAHEVWEQYYKLQDQQGEELLYHPDDPYPSNSKKVTPAPTAQVNIPTVMPISYNPNSASDTDDTLAVLTKVAETGDNTTVVAELQKITMMLDLAIRKILTNRPTLEPRYKELTRGNA